MSKEKAEFSAQTNIEKTSELEAEDVAQGSSVLGTYFNIVCVTAGVGILSLSKSASQGGWLSILFLLISAGMATYTSGLLIKCLYARSDKKLHTYSEVGYEAFGTYGMALIKTCHYSILLGAGTLFIMLGGINAHDIAEYYKSDVELKYWILMSGCLVGVPYCILRTMKEFVWMAVFGFLTTLVTLAIVVGLAFYHLIQLPETLPENITTETVIWAGLPSCLAVFSLAYAGNVVHPHLEGAMREPKKWPIALVLGLGTVCFFYLTMATVGYSVYGDKAKEIIFASLPQGALTTIGRVLITIHVLMTGPIIICSFGLEFENTVKISPEFIDPRKAMYLRLISRFITVTILTLVAMYVPHFMEFMAIIGSVFNCLNLYIFPILCHVKLFGLRNRSAIEYGVMICTLIIATICFFFGGYSSIYDMIKALSKPKN